MIIVRKIFVEISYYKIQYITGVSLKKTKKISPTRIVHSRMIVLVPGNAKSAKKCDNFFVT